MSFAILRGDARNLPLPDASVDLIVTSPPYFGLRSYTDGGEHYGGQIGAEPTPAEYVAALLECTREWMRVLKPSGSLWVNLGDKYVGGGQGGNVGGNLQSPHLNKVTAAGRGVPSGFRAKSLIGLPWRYALGCIDDLGLILRAEVIWSKPNGLPESVTDRVRRSHEQWFHLVKQPRYFSAIDEIREAHAGRLTPVDQPLAQRQGPALVPGNTPRKTSGRDGMGSNPLGKLPGSVWEIATQPLKVPAHLAVDHFAAFPMEWPRRLVLGWSPSGICTACGEGRRPVSERELTANRKGTQNQAPAAQVMSGGDGRQTLGWERIVTITGYACACPDTTAPTRPSVVLDPFGGTGTASLVADVLGRHGISIDRSADYCRLAAWRTAAPAERARALGVPKPPSVIDGQGDLFGAAS